jgi:hypothetical protein
MSKDAPRRQKLGDDPRPETDVWEPNDRSPGDKSNFVLSIEQSRRVVDIALDEARGHSEFDRQRACRSDRRGREVEPGDNRTAPGKADRVEPKMALQMNEPSAGHLSDLGINAAAQGVIAGLDTVNRVKTRPIAQVNGSAVVSVQPVGLHPGP